MSGRLPTSAEWIGGRRPRPPGPAPGSPRYVRGVLDLVVIQPGAGAPAGPLSPAPGRLRGGAFLPGALRWPLVPPGVVEAFGVRPQACGHGVGRAAREP